MRGEGTSTGSGKIELPAACPPRSQFTSGFWANLAYYGYWRALSGDAADPMQKKCRRSILELQSLPAITLCIGSVSVLVGAGHGQNLSRPLRASSSIALICSPLDRARS